MVADDNGSGDTYNNHDVDDFAGRSWDCRHDRPIYKADTAKYHAGHCGAEFHPDRPKFIGK